MATEKSDSKKKFEVRFRRKCIICGSLESLRWIGKDIYLIKKYISINLDNTDDCLVCNGCETRLKTIHEQCKQLENDWFLNVTAPPAKVQPSKDIVEPQDEENKDAIFQTEEKPTDCEAVQVKTEETVEEPSGKHENTKSIDQPTEELKGSTLLNEADINPLFLLPPTFSEEEVIAEVAACITAKKKRGRPRKRQYDEKAFEEDDAAESPKTESPRKSQRVASKKSEQNKKQAFLCEHCEQSFTTAYNLKMHKRMHVLEVNHSCKFCDRTFKRPALLKLHMQSHTSPYTCQRCQKTFTKYKLIEQHIPIHAELMDFPSRCPVCAHRFQDESHLDGHIKKVHAGAKHVYKCHKCDRDEFDSVESLTEHLDNHVDWKGYMCQVCGRQFAHQSTMQKHLATHSSDRPYKCTVCSATFKQHYVLVTHMRTHSGEKPYTCHVCGRSFTETGNLTKHLRSHQQSRPYVCTVCNRGFKLSNILKKHYIAAHTEETPYVCGLCNKGFKFRDLLQRHMRKHHLEMAGGDKKNRNVVKMLESHNQSLNTPETDIDESRTVMGFVTVETTFEGDEVKTGGQEVTIYHEELDTKEEVFTIALDESGVIGQLPGTGETIQIAIQHNGGSIKPGDPASTCASQIVAVADSQYSVLS